MTEKELWSYFLDKQVYLSKPLHRTLVWVKTEDFDNVRSLFKKEYNFLHPGRSFRSKGYLLHLHVIEQGEYALIHRDTANVARFFPFAIIHFFFDVLPYVLLAWWKRISFYSIFTPPQR
jgi:hypothetical protein